ncbi:bestrophin-3 domain protein, partial [Opisthorchis viverrini]
WYCKCFIHTIFTICPRLSPLKGQTGRSNHNLSLIDITSRCVPYFTPSFFIPLSSSYFEWVCIYCSQNNDLIPVPFVLGFYVSLVVARWWEQFLALPWPDQLALYLTAYCHGNGERPTRIRRTVMRYVNLSYCLALRAISSRARLRFPTEDHLVSAGLMTQDELDVYMATPPKEYTLYFVPLVWAMDIITKARREGHIRMDRAVEILSEEITSFRGRLGTIFGYDWINPPLVYTQTATIVVYAYFTSCLLAWQYLDPSKAYPGYEVDIYVPIFGLLRFFFYMGWLKVAESLINPFGEDVDDFEIEYLIERNL